MIPYRSHKNFARRNVTLRCDFVCESKKLIIEYDERQHFSEARRLALLSYPDLSLQFDRELWIDACKSIQARDNQPVDRDEVRAFYDSTRDIEAAKHGYKLVRIMHGQMDFEKEEALRGLKKMIGLDERKSNNAVETFLLDKPSVPIKIGLYLQTDSFCDNRKAYDEAMALVRKSDIDILVLPEFSYFTFKDEYVNGDFLNNDEIQSFYQKALDLSRDIGRAIVICNGDKYGTIMSIYANAFAEEGETRCRDYIKHTMTNFSAFDVEDYPKYAEYTFTPILYRGYLIGLTICYDCNHAVFSRRYGLNGVDIILNSTGGKVVYDKWYKYNKARAIENHCFNFVTMGGDDKSDNPHNYVYGFTPEGKEMRPILLNGSYDGRKNVAGGIYVYDISEYDGTTEEDSSINQSETVSKKKDLYVSESDVSGFADSGETIVENLRLIRQKENNIILCMVDGDDIMEPEKVLRLLYAEELKKIHNKKYIIINHWEELDMDYYRTKLSLILKVRAMENYCAVILSSPGFVKCFQSSQSRTVQVVKAEDGEFGIDLSRTSGPETIWKNKPGMKAAWRDNIEWLIDSMQ